MQQNINLLKIHTNTIKYIGSGSYSDVFLIDFNRGGCRDNTSNNSIDARCIFCQKIDISKQIVIKQIYITPKYDLADFTCETTYGNELCTKYPNIFLNILYYWQHEDNQLTKHNVVIPPIIPPTDDDDNNIIKPANIHNHLDQCTGIAYIITEYMPNLDLYTYFTHYTPSSTTPQLNIKGLIYILCYMLYILHNKMNITHGDLRDRNIFLNYRGNMWQQTIPAIPELHLDSIKVDTGGYEIKLGDYGLSELITTHHPIFIIRDYEFIDNIYNNRHKWKNTLSLNEFMTINSFMKIEILYDIYDRITKLKHKNQSIKDARYQFWFSKHRIQHNSIFIHELPQRMLTKYYNILQQTSI